jgi:predicted dehydrogenase
MNKTAAVIGCGKFGYYHAEKYANMEGVTLKGVCDLNPDAAKRACDKFLGCAYSDNYMDYKGVDLVSVVTPNEKHYEIAKFFIDSGSDVLIEKPMTESSLELKDLISRAEYKGVRLWGGFLERYNSVFVDQVIQWSPYIKEIYAHRSCAYRDCREHEDVVFDLMIHDIFLALLIMGNINVQGMEVDNHNSLSNCNDFVRAKIELTDGVKIDLTSRRDVEEKTKMFAIKSEGHFWKAYDLKRKSNDTLKEQLKDFASGKIFDLNMALKAMVLAEEILNHGEDK